MLHAHLGDAQVSVLAASQLLLGISGFNSISKASNGANPATPETEFQCINYSFYFPPFKPDRTQILQ